VSAKLVWDRGGEAEVVTLREDATTLVSTTPSPPGSRIEGTVATEPATRIKVKVHASRKRADGRFDIEGRPIDMTREARERVCAMIGDGRARA
jgi:hypothetical protein